MKRIYILGCARSGTTMACHMMNGFKGATVIGDEITIAAFRRRQDVAAALIGKRTFNSYGNRIAAYRGIALIAMVRHPYDVLTSRLLSDRFHVSAERWDAEARALAALLHERPDLLVLRYEDVATDPDRCQAVIAARFGLAATTPFSRFHDIAVASDRRATALGGLRAPDRDSIGRWSRSPDLRDHCAALHARIGGALDDFAARFGYDLTL